jgi:hypothetical protein
MAFSIIINPERGHQAESKDLAEKLVKRHSLKDSLKIQTPVLRYSEEPDRTAAIIRLFGVPQNRRRC